MIDFIKQTIENSELSNTTLKHSTTGDGRLDSAESEIIVVKHLIDLFSGTEIEVIPAPRERHWYDIMLKFKDEVYPVNIKITSGTSADNISSKLGVFYTLTGIDPETISGLTRWSSYNQLLVDNLKPTTTTNYYFIVYFKEQEKFLFTSLKHLDKLVANGNNLPFQCNWSDNLNNTQRSEEEQLKYLMQTYFDSWLKKTGGFEPLLQWKEIQNEN